MRKKRKIPDYWMRTEGGNCQSRGPFPLSNIVKQTSKRRSSFASGITGNRLYSVPLLIEDDKHEKKWGKLEKQTRALNYIKRCSLARRKTFLPVTSALSGITRKIAIRPGIAVYRHQPSCHNREKVSYFQKCHAIAICLFCSKSALFIATRGNKRRVRGYSPTGCTPRTLNASLADSY